MTEQPHSDDQRPVVRIATSDELPAVADVFLNSFDRFPDWPVSQGAEGFVRWLADSQGAPPGSPGRYAVVSDLNGTIVGSGIGQFRGARLRGRDVLSAVGPWGAMHPLGRGRGFYRAQRNFEAAPSDFSCGFSVVAQVQHVRGGEPRVTVANPWTIFVAIQHPLRAARTRGGWNWPLSAIAYTALALRARLQRRKPTTTPAWTVAPVDRCDERFDDLYHRAAEDFDLIYERTHEFLNYRYLDQRGGFFSILAAQTPDGQLLGYAAVTVIRGRGHIADLLVLPSRPDVTRSLIDASLQHCADLGSSAVECPMMYNHPYTPSLLRAGFIRFAARSQQAAGRVVLGARQIPIEQFREFGEDPHARVHLTEGDSELI